MADRVGDWVALVNARYPPATAADWDNVGLQVGDPEWPVERVLVTLDVTSAVVAEAEESDADGPATLVLAHHPLLFRPLERLTTATPAGRIALRAARSGIAVLAAHTNLDVAVDGSGTSDPVMRVLGIDDARPLTTETRDGQDVKLVTFVPDAHVGPVLDALAAAGAGVIGDYERCSFRVVGTGTFRPGPASDPYSGAVGEDNEEREARVEMVTPRSRVGAAVRALLDAHPYEEVAYDLYPLVSGGEVGFGRVGNLPGRRSLEEVATLVRDELPAPHLRFAGDPRRQVSRVAAVGGAGESLIPAAQAADADVLVTGDLKHHVVLDALESGLALVDAGHHATEVAALPAWIALLEQDAEQRDLTAQVLRSRTSTAPWYVAESAQEQP